jgi:hypothetical protein
MTLFRHIAAVGDCNTLGADLLEGNSYPERIGRRIGARVTNLGHTMATTREGVLLLRDFLADSECDCLLIQFGLADSYTTFKFSPYVLYYPDTVLRRPLRSLVKKFKKICRKTGFNSLLGQKNVVCMEEYERNIRSMVEMALPRSVFLIDTIPNKEVERNSAIQQYNCILDAVSDEYDRCFKVDLYDDFSGQFQRFYQDNTHCSAEGYEYITNTIYDTFMQVDFRK